MASLDLYDYFGVPHRVNLDGSKSEIEFTTALMVAEGSRHSNPSTIQVLKQAIESHVSPYLNNAYTDHECFSLVVPNELSLQCT